MATTQLQWSKVDGQRLMGRLTGRRQAGSQQLLDGRRRTIQVRQ